MSLKKFCISAIAVGMVAGMMSSASAALIPTEGALTIGTEYTNGVFVDGVEQSYGVYLGYFATGNDNDLERIIKVINESGVVTVNELTILGKDGPDGDQVGSIEVFGEGLTGTWTSSVGVDFYTVKAGNGATNKNTDGKSVSIWYIEPTATSGIWTTYGLENNGGNTPEISHLSGFAKPASVPEPSILSLFGLSLLGLGFIRRKKN